MFIKNKILLYITENKMNVDMNKCGNIINLTINRGDKTFSGNLEDSKLFRHRLYYVLKDCIRNGEMQEEDDKLKLSVSFYHRTHHFYLESIP